MNHIAPEMDRVTCKEKIHKMSKHNFESVNMVSLLLSLYLIKSDYLIKGRNIFCLVFA